MASVGSVLFNLFAATLLVAFIVAMCVLQFTGLFTAPAAFIGPAIRDVNEYVAQLVVVGLVVVVVTIIGVVGSFCASTEKMPAAAPIGSRRPVPSNSQQSSEDNTRA